MSASEKLKDLGEFDSDGELHLSAVLRLTDSLPQIVAVVEAAEAFGGEWDSMTRGDHARLDRLHSSVAALVEALS